MKEWASTAEVAQALGITRQAVGKRGAKQWTRRASGGRWEYLIASLPAEARQALARRALRHREAEGEHALAGREAAQQLLEEQTQTEEERQAARVAALARWNTLPEHVQQVAEAREQILRACEAYLKTAGFASGGTARSRPSVDCASRSPSGGTWSKKGCLLFLEDLSLGRTGLGEAISRARCRTGGGLSYGTLLSWRQAWEAEGRTGLAPGYRAHNRRQTSVAPSVQKFAVSVLCNRPHLQTRMLAALCRARFRDAAPHEAALRRFVAAWKAEHQSLYCFLTNPDQWRQTHQFITGRADAEIEALNQLWEFDSTAADLLCTDGRQCIVGVIDVWSRRAKLHVVPTSRAVAVAALARRAILDWGLPEAAKTDNGQDYTSDYLCRVFADLHVEHWLCEPFRPDQKPHIESFFKTFSHGLLELLPGYVGHSVAERKHIEARRAFAQRLRTRGESVDVRLSSAELQQFCDRWVETVYHRNPHSGLDGQSPEARARSWTGPVRRIDNPRALDILLWEAPEDGGWRTVGQRGVRVQNRHYIAAEMTGHEREKVRVYLDPFDLSRVCVYRMNPETGLREFLCWAEDPTAPQADRAEFRARVRATQKKLVGEQVKEIRKDVKGQALEQVTEEYFALREEEGARVIALPSHRERGVTTPALEEAARAAQALEACPYAITEETLASLERIPEPPTEKVTEIPTRIFLDWMELHEHLRTIAKARPLTEDERSRLAETWTESLAVRQLMGLRGETPASFGL